MNTALAATSEIAVTEFSEYIQLSGLSDFLISQIFDCGQCFRFDAAKDGAVEGVAYGRYVRFEQPSPDILLIHGATNEDYQKIWRGFLALDTDYAAVKRDISERFGDGVMRRAMEYGSGIRILRQEPWETLCSFIISQNNNIPRIKKTIARLCEKYGEKIECGEKTHYRFPDAQRVASATDEELHALGAGFRSKYIIAAARRVSEELDLGSLAVLPTESLMEVLQSFYGVGPKVASCVALFAYGKTEAFPIDVWIRRVLLKYYPDGLDISNLGKWAGVAQQYLFYFERWGS